MERIKLESGIYEIKLTYQAAYGMGEKFNGINQKGNKVVNTVEEKFCFQGEKTYCPIPFFFTDTGVGICVKDDRKSTFSFEENGIRITAGEGSELLMFKGTPEQIISEYMSVFGKAKLPPKWAFGIWASANCWNSQKRVEAALDKLHKYEFPTSVLVLEAWSDEATFYNWNDKEYPNPEEMIKRMHEKGIHLVLWQIPVYKKQEEEEEVSEHNEKDRADAVKRRLCVMKGNGDPYVIPENNWFSGSMIPDFTNKDTVKEWFSKRRYLLDMGVDGFKTDGGEFIYEEDVIFANGSTGVEGKNRYCLDYTTAYHEFLGDDRVLFSRAGFAGQHTVPIHWAGDQQSQNIELRSQLSAGLSAAMSGIPFWSFDIAGFAGPLPELDLYRRATQMACFCPIMQWHSEAEGGQFKELMAGHSGNNERSPWNMEEAYHAEGFMDEIRYWHNLRMNLLPYIYSTALDCVKKNKPMMRPMAYCWPEERKLAENEEQYMLGESLLVVPLLEENPRKRAMLLPEGGWYNLFTSQRLEGGVEYSMEVKDKLPVFVKEGSGVALRLPETKELGGSVGNSMEVNDTLDFIITGQKGGLHYSDNDKNDFMLKWDKERWYIDGATNIKINVIIWK